jgi:hypothetical protein
MTRRISLVAARGGRRELGGGPKIRNVDDASIEKRLPGRIISGGTARIGLFDRGNSLRAHVVIASHVEQLAVVPEDNGANAAAQRDRVPCDRVEHGLDVRR